MWILSNIKGHGIASFNDIDYSPEHGVATLILGHNEDNIDNQPSNGSGKSALIEAISIAITGEPLRKVSIDEIINDRMDDMDVSATFSNNETSSIFVISRHFGRKGPQTVSVSIDGNDFPLATVADANKFIIEKLGVTKDELYSYFILTEQKYKSFFAASDKDKKEIINKFSNANLVDVAIEILKADMDAEAPKVTESQNALERCKGAVTTLEEQIQNAEISGVNEREKAEARKLEILDLISKHRGEIRSYNSESNALRSKCNEIDQNVDTIKSMQEGTSLPDLIAKINELGISVNTELIPDQSKMELDIERYEAMVKEAEMEIGNIEVRIQNGGEAINVATEKYETAKAKFDEKFGSFDSKVSELGKTIDSLTKERSGLRTSIRETMAQIDECKRILSGKIVCPKCGHGFFIDNGKTPELVSQELKAFSESLEQSKLKSKELEDRISDLEDEEHDMKLDRNKESGEISDLEATVNRYKAAIDAFNNQIQAQKSTIERYRFTIQSIKDKIARIYDDTVDLAVNALNKDLQTTQLTIKGHGMTIAQLEGMINSLQIEYDNLVKRPSGDALVQNLKKAVEDKRNEMNEAEKIYNEHLNTFSKYAEQEKIFNRFKSRLANSKISALSQTINGILASLGSDLKVRINGFQILKSGAIRDKISVEIMRGGEEFGSYYKLSKGERCRIDVACIIAMQSLINDNAGDGKGISLLVMDEIMNGVDELGLVDIYKALNRIRQTAIVVSHNQVSASYPHKITVSKKNGISTILN